MPLKGCPDNPPSTPASGATVPEELLDEPDELDELDELVLPDELDELVELEAPEELDELVELEVPDELVLLDVEELDALGADVDAFETECDVPEAGVVVVAAPPAPAPALVAADVARTVLPRLALDAAGAVVPMEPPPEAPPAPPGADDPPHATRATAAIAEVTRVTGAIRQRFIGSSLKGSTESRRGNVTISKGNVVSNTTGEATR
jgi:hypothetical protein